MDTRGPARCSSFELNVTIATGKHRLRPLCSQEEATVRSPRGQRSPSQREGFIGALPSALPGKHGTTGSPPGARLPGGIDGDASGLVHGNSV